MRTLFFLGNKRSGTSNAVRVLNSHPEIFVAREADIVWALFCRERGRPVEPYPDDGPRGLRATMAAYGTQLASTDATVAEAFDRVLRDLAVRAGKEWETLALVGDKKPVQQADPAMFDFAIEHWPDAQFIHIPRHPRAVVASMMDMAAGVADWNCWNRPAEELVDYWTRNEQRVLQHKAAGRAPILTIPFHELAAEPEAKWDEVLTFLGMASDPRFEAEARNTRREMDEKYRERQIPLSDAASEIVRLYGLELSASSSRPKLTS